MVACYLLMLKCAYMGVPCNALYKTVARSVSRQTGVGASHSMSTVITVKVVGVVAIPLVKGLNDRDTGAKCLLMTVVCKYVFTTYRFFYFTGAGRRIVVPRGRGVSVGIRLETIVRGHPCVLTLVKRILFKFALCKEGTSILCCFACMRKGTSCCAACSVYVVVPSVVNTTYFRPMFHGLGGGKEATSVFTLLAKVSVLYVFFFGMGRAPATFCALTKVARFFFSKFGATVCTVVPSYMRCKR